MSRGLRTLGLLSAALAAAAAHADSTITVQANIPYNDTDWHKSLAVRQFDPSVGQLTSVDVVFHGAMRNSAQFENLNSSPRSFSANFAYSLVLTRPGGTSTISLMPGGRALSGSLTGYDGATDYKGGSGKAFPELVSEDSRTVTLSGDDVLPFLGATDLSLPVDATATGDVTAPGNFSILVLNQALADVKVTYHYTPYALGSLGDRLWFDMNANGIQDPGEKGLVGVGVKLLNASGTVLKTTTTGADGIYLFQDLPAGDYKVQFDKPAGYGFVTRNVGMNDLVDSDADGSGLTDLVHLNTGQNRLDVDAGVAGCLCLGDRVWKDLDRDGLQDGCEPGVPGVSVHLLDDDDNVIADTVTDANGLYRFINVAAGDYTVDFDAPAGTGFTKQYANPWYKAYDSNADADTGRASVTLTNSDLTIDAGLVGALKIGDTVWLDSDGDGRFDVAEGEKGIKGVRVYLLGDLDGDGRADVSASTVTDASGHYAFNSLYPGNYMVSVNPNDVRNLTPTYDLDGKNTANYAIARLLPNTDNLDFDFGYKPTSCGGGATHCWWQVNPGCWPHSSLWIGGKCHSKSTVCSWLKIGECADKSISLYQRLCAAKLNLGAGCDGGTVITCGALTCSVKDAIRKADLWLAAHPVGCRVSASSNDWKSISDCFGILDKFCGK